MKTISRLALVVVVLLGFCAPGVHARTWKQVHLGQITLVSDASDADIHDAAANLADLRYVLDQIIQEDPSWRKPLFIVYFADQSEMQPYLPEVAPGTTIDDAWRVGESRTVREAANAPDWVAADASANMSDQVSQIAISGAVVTWYIDALEYRVPTGIRQGFNRVMSTFRRESDRAILGDPLPNLRGILYHARPIPISDILAESDWHHVIVSGDRRGFQAESWGLVHYLMFGKGNQTGHAFRLFMQALSEHKTPNEALVAAVGPNDAAHIDFLVRTYLRGAVYAARVPMPPRTEDTTAIMPADTETVELALARGALVGRRPSALAHVDAAIAAAPGDPRPLALKAEVLDGLSRPADEVRSATDAAFAAGSQDPWIVYRTASHRMHAAKSDLSADDARAIIRLAEHSANSNRNYHPIFDVIARCLWHCPPRANDSTFLNFAANRFPTDRWILVGQAAIAHGRGDQAEANRLLAQAQSDDPAFSPDTLDDVRTFVAELKLS